MKLKRCPSCHAEHQENAIICGCGAEISLAAEISIRPLIVTQIVQPPEIAQPEADHTETSCPACDKATPAVLPLCIHCGTRLTTSTPKLFLLVGTRRIECRDGDVLGRAGSVACELFAGIGTVSSRHAQLCFEKDCWNIKPIAKRASDDPASEGVRTYMNGKLLPPYQPTPIPHGRHRIQLSSRAELDIEVSNQ